jgi:putative transposase
VFAFVEAERAEYGVPRLCRVLKVSRSGYYAWRARRRGHKRSKRDRDDDVLSRTIVAVFDENHQRYGSPRILVVMRADGFCVGRRRVRRLMRQHGLRARYRRRRTVTTNSNPSLRVVANVLNREFTSTAPNQKWVGDVTYLRVPAGFAYLAVLIDLFSRRVVGHAVSTTNDEALTLAALHAASAHRPTHGCLHHTDRGSTYTSSEYQDALRRRGFVVSMSGKGDCFDNAVAESFFSTLKAELGDQFASASVALQETGAFIDLYYNTKRLHSTLGYQSPVGYEKMNAQQAVR